MKCPPEYKRDPRYFPIVQEMYNECRRDVCNYLENPEGEILASVTDDKYTVVITKGGRILFIRNDLPNKPACAGRWMDFPEEHWNISEEEYYKLSVEERAKLEAKEQLSRWVHREFEKLFVETWCPDLWDKFWWEERGSEMPEEQRQIRVHELFEVCKMRVMDP